LNKNEGVEAGAADQDVVAGVGRELEPLEFF
jgi:hypothetical protein